MMLMKRTRNEANNGVSSSFVNNNKGAPPRSFNEIRREIRIVQAQRQLVKKQHDKTLIQPLQQRIQKLDRQIKNCLDKQSNNTIYRQTWNERNMMMMSDENNNDDALPEEEQLLILAHGVEIKQRLLKRMIQQNRSMTDYMTCEIHVLEEERKDITNTMQQHQPKKSLEKIASSSESEATYMTTTFTTPQRNLMMEEEDEEEHQDYYYYDNKEDNSSSSSSCSSSFAPSNSVFKSVQSVGSISTNTTVMIDDDESVMTTTTTKRTGVSSWFRRSSKKQDQQDALSSNTLEDVNGFTEILL